MKPIRITVPGWLLGSVLCGFCEAKAQDAVPCLIFTGNSDTEHCIDLAQLNRITFGDDGITVSSSKDPGAQSVKLLYSLFNHFEIGDATPTSATGVDDVIADTDPRLLYRSDSKSLVIESTSETPYTLGIFSLKGSLIATSKINAGQAISVEALSAGVYVAVATDGNSKLTLKFIIN